jgi:hypothetical protein
MKRLSISLPAIALVLVLAFSGAAFTSTPAATDNNIAKAPVSTPKQSFLLTHPNLNKVYVYYWFWEPSDTYNDEENQAMEIFEMEEFYYPGCVVDTNPVEGTLILEGYMMANQPHASNPANYLYVHY